SVDRTAGTHPIRQELANLDEAGSLYGAIIYDKAPIVMRQLEKILGSDRFQAGLQAYLKKFEFGNATWLDLVASLNAESRIDVSAWSHAWVEEPGRPLITTKVNDRHVTFTQSDPQPGRSLRWPERMEVVAGTAEATTVIPVELNNERAEVDLPSSVSNPEFILPTGGGLAYGDFALDAHSRAYLLHHLPELQDPLTRGAAWVTLWEEMLDRRVGPMEFVSLDMSALEREHTEQNVQLMLRYLDEAFWTFLSAAQRQQIAPKMEQVLRAGIAHSVSSTMKSTY